MSWQASDMTSVQRAQLTAYRPVAGEKADCRHPGTPPLRLAQGRGLRVVRQCLLCGAIGKTVPWEQVGLTREQVLDYDMVDPDIAERWAVLRGQRRAARREQHDEDAASIHASAWWQDMRQRVLERDGHLCQGCLRAPATQVHHRRYCQIDGRRVGGEPGHWLVSLCDRCHRPGPEERWTGMPDYGDHPPPEHARAILAAQRQP